jgi:DNA-binding beta-propeller fold protein YncE
MERSRDAAQRRFAGGGYEAVSVIAAGLDCRGKSLPETGRAVIERFNALAPGAQFEVCVDAYAAGLRIGLLEAGARHAAERRDDGVWRLRIARGLAPAQGSVSGVHHVVSDGISLWTCERGEFAARIDAQTQVVIATGRVARKASHLALDAAAGRLFIADSEADEVIALRAADLEPEQRWSAPGGPQLPLVNPDGVVCVTGPASGTLTIARPTNGGYRTQTIAVGACPHDPLLAAGGEHVFVPCTGGSDLAKVRLADGRIVGRCQVGNGPSHLALHPDGRRIYSANSWDGTVTCLTADGERVADAPSGGWAHAIETTPDGRWLYVANFLDDTLAVFEAATLKRVALLATDAYPHGLDVSPDGRYVIATGFASDHVRVFDAGTHCELARVAVGMGSSHTVFAGAAAYIGCSVSDYIACIDLATLSLKGQTSIH